MARRKTTRRYYTRARKTYRRARGGGGGFKDLIDGGLAGAIGEFAQKWLGAYSHPVSALGVGWFRKNSTLKITGARELGAMLVTQVGMGTGKGGVYD